MKGDGSPFEFAALEPDRQTFRTSDGETGDDVGRLVYGSGHPLATPAGVLCIHGFTGTPFEMRYLGSRLAQRGYRVLGPALAGHGTTPGDLDRTTWRDWYGGVQAAFDRLRACHDRVFVVGQSLGGLLALHLARERGTEIAALACLATPLWLPAVARWAVRTTRPGSLMGRWVRSVPKLSGSDVADRAMKKSNPAYPVIPLRALHQLVEFMALVRTELPAISNPLAILHGRRDHTVPFGCSTELAARVASPDPLHRALDRSYHLIAIDVERSLVARTVGDFFDSRRIGVKTGADARASGSDL
ncbi:MAG: alpha/beta fold hydrolase [Proteobacteria bacterium]|nr:alpha/beta fold hydrolase [Pseudomonadota bacterium]